MWEMYCMPNCWLWAGQNSKKLSTSIRRSFFSSSSKFSTWFCRSSIDTRQFSDSPLPSLSILHRMRAASLARRDPKVLAPCNARPWCSSTQVLMLFHPAQGQGLKGHQNSFISGTLCAARPYKTSSASAGLWLVPIQEF